MKKLLPALLSVLIAAAAAVNVCAVSDEEIIVRAVASSYPDADFGVKTAICAVILNRIDADGFGSCAAEVIGAEGSGFDVTLLCGEIDEKTLRITRDACRAAVCGADPTGGLLYFEKLPEPGRGENRVEFEENADLSAYRAVIGGYGFR